MVKEGLRIIPKLNESVKFTDDSGFEADDGPGRPRAMIRRGGLVHLEFFVDPALT